MWTEREITVVGAGPAGSAAAIAARQAGARVTLCDPSNFPRHKVCGEFLSPGILPWLERLGVAADFFRAAPAPIARMELHAGSSCKSAPLPETAYGLSRYRFDDLLFAAAVGSGARFRRERVAEPSPGQVWATGRNGTATRGSRLFGFKAHYEGPARDAVELFFFPGGYLGINSIEDGRTNVCGLAREDLLQRWGFRFDDLLDAQPAIRERLAPLQPVTEWLSTGPLLFRNRLTEDEPFYRAGDALSFVDPFTGSGLLTAVFTGAQAGECAAVGIPPNAYRSGCRYAIRKQLRFSSWLRELAGTSFAEAALPFVPARLLFRLTRPKVA